MRLRSPLARSRIIGILIATVISIAGLSATGVTPANAATCYATSCAGHDPTTHGCSATSTTSYSGSLATVWNRYSAGCDANWGRAQLTAAALAAGDTMYVEIYTYEPGNYEESMCWPTDSNDQGIDYEFCNGNPYGGSSIVYTDMVDGTYETYADVSVFDSSYNLIAEYEADQ